MPGRVDPTCCGAWKRQRREREALSPRGAGAARAAAAAPHPPAVPASRCAPPPADMADMAATAPGRHFRPRARRAARSRPLPWRRQRPFRALP